MPCQCGTTASGATSVDAEYSGCGCATESGCDCGSGTPPPSDHETSLERIVMELDKRVRRLEASR
jgi:hypothetical protein